MSNNPYEPPRSSGSPGGFNNGAGFELKVAIKSTPSGGPKGQFKCAVAADGLTLTQGKKQQIAVPVGTAATYAGANKIAVPMANQRLEITLAKFGSYQNRLARDLAAFIQGSGRMPNLPDYRLPAYLYVLCALPIGIPILTLGGAIPAGIGFGAAGACFGIAQKEEWSTAARVLTILGVSLAAYVGTFAIVFAIAAARG